MELSTAPTGLVEGINEIVAAIFENMLGVPATLDRLAGEIPMELSARVGFSGSWIGLVILASMRQDARRLAACFLSLPHDRIDDRMAGDVLGELTNMVAGNLKPLFALNIQLSNVEVLPSGDVVSVDFVPTVCETLHFRCSQGSLLVKVRAAPQSMPKGE